MTKEALEKRLAELQTALEQITANGNATVGAINECRYWIKQLEEGAGETPAPIEAT